MAAAAEVIPALIVILNWKIPRLPVFGVKRFNYDNTVITRKLWNWKTTFKLKL